MSNSVLDGESMIHFFFFWLSLNLSYFKNQTKIEQE